MDNKHICLILLFLIILLIFNKKCCSCNNDIETFYVNKSSTTTSSTSQGTCDCVKCSNIVKSWFKKGWHYDTDQLKTECSGCPRTVFPNKFDKSKAKCK